MDKLEQFADWIQNNRETPFTDKIFAYGWVPENTEVIRWYEEGATIVWGRKDDLQAQLIFVHPWTIIPEHVHPNIDSFEMHVGGDIILSVDGKWHTEEMSIHTNEYHGEELSERHGHMIRIRPGQVHGAYAGPRGGIFMSIQRWLNGVQPTCVVQDWNGIALSSSHIDGLEKPDQDVVHVGEQKELTWQHAASKETMPPPWIRNSY